MPLRLCWATEELTRDHPRATRRLILTSGAPAGAGGDRTWLRGRETVETTFGQQRPAFPRTPADQRIARGN